MRLLEKFINNAKQHDLFHLKDKLLLAVSGGVDSVVLCELCKQAGFNFSIAHCNFRLRDKESERDKEFVAQLAKKYDVEFLVKDFATNEFAASHKLSIQEAARNLRYDWFSELVNGQLAIGNRQTKEPFTIYLLTAHHTDDNAETVLMNFCRGTGLQGLTGIPVKTGHIRRPLLGFAKEELLQFAKDNNLAYVEDSSNESSKYTRNMFRNEIIPAIRKAFPQASDNLKDNINRFIEIESLYRYTVDGLIKKICKIKGNEVHIPVRQLMAFKNRALIYEIISRYGFSEKQVVEVIKLCASESGHFISNSTYRIIKHRHWLIIAPLLAESAETIIIEETTENMQLAIGNLQMAKIIFADCLPIAVGKPIDNSVACLDAKNIKFPLLIRKWKTGDYFYPLGMKKKKKLSRFFIDQKLSKPEKEKIWVIEMNQKIIWVVGQRIDERFKITDMTRNVLRFTIR